MKQCLIKINNDSKKTLKSEQSHPQADLVLPSYYFAVSGLDGQGAVDSFEPGTLQELHDSSCRFPHVLSKFHPKDFSQNSCDTLSLRALYASNFSNLTFNDKFACHYPGADRAFGALSFHLIVDKTSNLRLVQYKRNVKKLIRLLRLIESLSIFFMFMKIPFLFECTKLIAAVTEFSSDLHFGYITK